MKIGIVGALGVGKAHAIAARDLGHDIAFVVDPNPAAEHVYHESHLINNWGAFSETAPLNPDIPYFPYLDDYFESNESVPDLIIIASPDQFHHAAVKQITERLPTTKVLCEKPYCSDIDHPNVYVSCEWVYHPEIFPFLNADRVHNLSFCHSFWEPGWRHDIRMDLGFHLLSLLYVKYGQVPDKTTWLKVSDKLVHGVADFDGEKIAIGLAYNPEDQGIENFGNRETGPNTPEIRITHDENFTIGLNWYDRAFHKQLEKLLCGGHFLTSRVARKIDAACRTEGTLIFTRCAGT